MTEKEQQSPYPMLPATGTGYGGDTEATAVYDTRDQRKKKRNKCILYIVLFAIFQCAVIAVFAVTIAKVRTPRFRINSATLENINVGSPSNPAFAGRMNARFSIKNANYGRYRYRDTNVQFFYRGMPVGEAFVPNSRVGWRTTRRVNVGVDLNLGDGRGNAQLVNDLSGGIVPITSRARMSGRVELIFVMKRNRATHMNCSMEIVTATQQLRNIVCN